MLTVQSKPVSMSRRRRDASPLIVACADCVRTFKTLLDPYRPERHYMRGPGPRWHAKHDQAGIVIAHRASYAES
jgi:hypothetical protein